MHIVRCDDQSYLSFARQLLRSLSNVKNGTVTKHIGDVTVTVRKVFGHEYVSIADGGGGWYEFFTTGDLPDNLHNLTIQDLQNLLKIYQADTADSKVNSNKFVQPSGYRIRAKCVGSKVTSELVYTTNNDVANVDKFADKYIPKDVFFQTGKYTRLPIQVNNVHEPIYHSKYKTSNFSVWSQNPTRPTDVGYDIVANKILNGRCTDYDVKTGDYNWPRTVAITKRLDKFITLVITRHGDIYAYFNSDLASGDYKPKDILAIPECRADFVERPWDNSCNGIEFDIKLNSDCTKLCFTYNLLPQHPSNSGPLYRGFFVEYLLDVSLVQNGDKFDIALGIKESKRISPNKDLCQVYACDYLMYVDDVSLFNGAGVTDDLILIKNEILVSKKRVGRFYSKYNYFVVVNESSSFVVVKIPHNNNDETKVNGDIVWKITSDGKYGFGGRDLHQLLHVDVNYEVVHTSVRVEFEAISLKSLSLAFKTEVVSGNGDTPISSYEVYVFGKKVFYSGDVSKITNNIKNRTNTEGSLSKSGAIQLNLSLNSYTEQPHTVKHSMFINSNTVLDFGDRTLVGGSLDDLDRVKYPNALYIANKATAVITCTNVEIKKLPLYDGFVEVAEWDETTTRTIEYAFHGKPAPPDDYTDGLIDDYGGWDYIGGALDPMHGFSVKPNGSWAYTGFLRLKSDPACKDISDTNKTTEFGDSLCFDCVCFSAKTKEGFTQTYTTHKQLFQNATGLAFNNSFLLKQALSATCKPTNFYQSFVFTGGYIGAGYNTAIFAIKTFPNIADKNQLYKVPFVAVSGCFT